jgi:hypothetical protein
MDNASDCHYIPDSSYPTGTEVKFDIDEAWKGASDQAVVYTGTGGGDCGYPFEIGRKYLVYASLQKEGWLYAGICGETKSLSEAGGDVSVLDGLRLNDSGNGGTFGISHAQLLIILSASLAGVLGVVALGLVVSRGRSN